MTTGEERPVLPPTVQDLLTRIRVLETRLEAAEKRGGDGEMKYVQMAGHLEELKKQLAERQVPAASGRPSDPEPLEEVEDDRTEPEEDWGFL